MRQVAALFASFFFAASAAAADMPGEPPKVDMANGEAIATQQCVACHGSDGNSAAGQWPKLAGQHADYLYKQLRNFKVQEGAETAERENAVMAGFAAMLSDQDMRDVSAYYAAQEIEPGFASNKELLEMGQEIYRAGIAEKSVPACAGCHSPNGAGIPAQYPRLSAQHAEYTASQLKAFRDGVRNNSAQMSTISARLSDKEIQAVSDYIAGLR
ncbi:MAG: c-type cytochrome [Limnobacter sp.]|nr:c-type cytochrome [Limnobacter sp.]